MVSSPLLSRWLQTVLPKTVFVVLTLCGIGFIWVAKSQGWSAQFTLAVPVFLMFAYFLMSSSLAGLRLHNEQAGDNLYYMGFLFTLTSLGEALYRFNVADPIDTIVRNFGVAIVTTICGIGLRIFYNQIRRDPIEIERVARHELAEMARRVRLELEATAREFANFRRVSNQMLQEGFEEIGKQAEKSGAQILKALETLTQEAITPIRNASDQIKSMLDDVGVKTEGCLTSALGRMESSTTNFEGANLRLADTLAAFGSEVEEARAKLTKVKTPDELVSIRLKPTLTTLEELTRALAVSDQERAQQAESLRQTLEKLVAMHAQAQAASDQGRADRAESLQKTQRSVDGATAVMERSVLAMEKRLVESAAHSQLIVESVERLIKQQHADLRQYIEMIEDRRSHALGHAAVDESTSKLSERSRPSPETRGPGTGSQKRPAESAPTKPRQEAPDEGHFRWLRWRGR
jgi:hypothetical protein